MADDDFELWLGRIGSDRPLQSRLRAAINRAGGVRRLGRAQFTGARIGRGSGVGALLASRGPGHRRAVVKARIVRLGPTGLARARAHLRYLHRDSTSRDGGRADFYRADEDRDIDAKAFLERGAGDRHHFRFIVAPEDGAEYDDLKPLIRRWMKQAEHDLGTKLDWVAVDHFNTGHPHTHVVVRGVDDRGQDLVIARNYMAHGLRTRAVELVDLDLGPRSPMEIMRAEQREIEQERFTAIDQRLLHAARDKGVVMPAHGHGVEQSLRAGRLKMLGRMGLATETRHGIWRLSDDLESALRTMGARGDIVRTMRRALREQLPERSPVDFVIGDPLDGQSKSVIGKVIERGLSDEYADRHYVIVDGVDGHSHYVDVGASDAETRPGSIVRITPVSTEPREVDRTIAEVAAANGGRYSVDLHLQHDRNASHGFAEAHERRLEAIRRATAGVEREPNGTWRISSDHLDRVQNYERHRAKQMPFEIETLSIQPLEQLAAHDGATWLDRTLAGSEKADLARGFGADVRKALQNRAQWLVEQHLAEVDDSIVRLSADAIVTLQQRELRRVAGQLSSELGLEFVKASSGDQIEGIFRRSVLVGDAKYAVIEKSRDFTLVPWKPTLDRAVGKPVSGIMRESGVSWTIGRGRSGPEVGGF